MVIQRLSHFFLILTFLLGTACVVETGDDDDASGDDDDASGPMVLTFTISNGTGYDFTYLNWGIYIGEEGSYWEDFDGMTDGFGPRPERSRTLPTA